MDPELNLLVTLIAIYFFVILRCFVFPASAEKEKEQTEGSLDVHCRVAIIGGGTYIKVFPSLKKLTCVRSPSL